MALSEDQKAMLRLLAQRGEQGYEDLAALLGIGVDEVHARATEAAAQLEAEGIPAPPIPAPPGAAPSGGTEPNAPRSEPTAAERPPRRAPAPQKSSARPRRPAPQIPKFSLPSDGRTRIAAGAGLLALIGLIVIFALSGGEPDEPDPPTSGETTTAAGANSQLTQAVLEPVGEGEGKGVAVFGRIRKNVVLQVQAEGLEPSPEGSSYTVWLYKSPQLALRVGSVRVTESGGIASQFPVPRELLTYIATETFDQIDVSLTSDAAYRRELASARKAERLPAYTGESVLRGPITGPAIEAVREAGAE